ncbi:MAG: serine/threonine-protein kinase [Mollicutes bacterium]|nr:MAG: serine/threonine-protein kinase [Mollicutes bacterium]
MDTNIGKIIKKRYEILEKLSVESFSQIYLSQDIKLNRQVILKILSPKTFLNKKTEEIFRNEIEITSQLRHRYIVNLYDYFTFENKWCLVLQYIKATTMRELLNRGEKFNEEKIKKIFLQILEALQFAEQKKIVHRDLKPENIFINQNNQVKIFDFGISVDHFFSSNVFSSKPVGSAKYIAPEIIVDQKITTQSDIYAIGIMLYEILIGQVPYFNDDNKVIMKKHLYEKMIPARQYDSKISQQMENIIIRATAKNLDERYSNTQSIIDDFKKLGTDLKVKPVILKNDFYKNFINSSEDNLHLKEDRQSFF